MKVLVADDQNFMQRLLEHAFRKQGFQVIRAGDGIEAVDLAREHRPDLIVTDLQMPKLDGIGLIKRIRADSGLRNVPIMVLTAFGVKQYVLDAVNAGASDFLVKSDMKIEVLIDRARKLLAKQEPKDLVLTGRASPATTLRRSPRIAAESPPTGGDREPASDATGTEGLAPKRKKPRSDEPPLTRESLEQRLAQALEPKALPFVAAELSQLTASSTTTVKQLAETIQRDQALTVRVMKVANSAFYAHLGRVQTLTQAIKQIGFRGIRDMAIAVQIMEKYRGEDGAEGIDPVPFWKHALACGILAKEILARLSKDPDMLEESFLAGLLHDVGKVVLTDLFPSGYSRIVSEAAASGLPLHEAEKEAFEFSHADVARRMLPKWGLLDGVVDPVVRHHLPWEALAGRGEDKGKLRITGAVRAANVLVKAERIGAGGDVTLEAFPDDLAELLDLDREKTIRLLDDLDSEVKEMTLILLMHDSGAAPADPEGPRLPHELWLLRERPVAIDPVELLLVRAGVVVHVLDGPDGLPETPPAGCVLVRSGSVPWLAAVGKRLGAGSATEVAGFRPVLLADAVLTDEGRKGLGPLGGIPVCPSGAIPRILDAIASDGG